MLFRRERFVSLKQVARLEFCRPFACRASPTTPSHTNNELPFADNTVLYQGKRSATLSSKSGQLVQIAKSGPSLNLHRPCAS
eukprot:scaffold1046_cov162-Ochromonas_danica.AAC.30